jgi:peptide-methionine (S)-S-oxide reductase
MPLFRWCLLPLAALAACSPDYQPKLPDTNAAATPAAPRSARETAVFAGGCFWCTESDFEKVPGVLSAVSGFSGGTARNPTYKQVSAGGTGHYESVRVTFDPAKVSYTQLAHYFFRTVDPTDAGGQFCDRGPTYRTAIFVADDVQRKAAEAEKAQAQATLGKPVETAILAAGQFWPAEGYHQDYAHKNSLKYHYYRSRCGRDARLEEVWGGKPA